MHVLLVDHGNDYDPPDVHGPFESIKEAQQYAEKFRALNDLPPESAPENNEIWTEAGWYFGIFEPFKVDFDQPASAPRRSPISKRGSRHSGGQSGNP